MSVSKLFSSTCNVGATKIFYHSKNIEKQETVSIDRWKSIYNKKNHQHLKQIQANKQYLQQQH